MEISLRMIHDIIFHFVCFALYISLSIIGVILLCIMVMYLELFLDKTVPVMDKLYKFIHKKKNIV